MKTFNSEKKYDRYILSIAFVIGIFFIFGRFFIDLSFPESDYNFIDTDSAKIYPNSTITQKFTAKENGLNQIKIAFRNVSIGPDEKILLELSKENCLKVISSDKIAFFSIRPGAFYKFNFDRITESKGKDYCIQITHKTKDPSAKREIRILTSDDDQFQEKSFFNAGKGKNYEGETLVIRPAYGNENLWQDLGELNNRLSQYKPWFLKGVFITTIATLFLIGSVALVFLLIFL